MQWRWSRPGIIAIAAILLFMAAQAAYRSFETGLCEVTVRERVPSPGGGKVAVVFEKDCGATTDFNTQLAIGAPSDTAAPDKLPIALSMKGRHQLALQWRDEATLSVTLPPGETIYRQEPEAAGVALIYGR